MDSVIISQETKVYKFQYPFAEKLNPKLHRIILEKAQTLDKGALMTPWMCFDVPEFKLISDYALHLIKTFKKDSYTPTLSSNENEPLVLKSLWGQVYNKGSYQEIHDHHPTSWSMVYYVNTPKGSSPLVFSNSEKNVLRKKRVFPKSGEMVLFPGWLYHYVPPNRCEGRSIVAGNFYYRRLISTNHEILY